MVDAATVVSARLARDWSRYTSVYEIPDYLNPSHYPGLEQEGQEEVWIGLSPAASHATLLQSGLAAALELVCRQYPQVRVILPDIEKKALKDLDVDPARLITCSSPFFDEWVDLLLRLDLGLAPFASDFDLRLGPVHLLEFMIAKVPWIATQRPAFPELSGYGMWVQNAPQAWAVALAKAVDGLAFYQKKAGGESFLYALGQEAGAHIDKALQIYSAIASR
jgi:glycosyltransferase involved in cell wall biosynthesis